MINQIIIIAIALVFALLALFFRRSLKKVENPTWVLEKPPMPKDLSFVITRLDKWRAEGRISREDYERLMYLCQEDAAKAALPEN